MLVLALSRLMFYACFNKRLKNFNKSLLTAILSLNFGHVFFLRSNRNEAQFYASAPGTGLYLQDPVLPPAQWLPPSLARLWRPFLHQGNNEGFIIIGVWCEAGCVRRGEAFKRSPTSFNQACVNLCVCLHTSPFLSGLMHCEKHFGLWGFYFTFLRVVSTEG